MAIKIYAAEIIDGISNKVEQNTSVACVSSILPAQPKSVNINDVVKKYNLALANSNPEQPDLFYLQSILVSSGWNLNDDYFMPAELAASASTPEDKPFNYMHNDMDIIGHITSNQLVDLDGNVLAIQEGTELPENINILTDAVIYRFWSNEEQQARIDKIISEILEDKWFVSMEAFFSGFDYVLRDGNGVTKLVERNESTAYLTKHLRVYGGSGVVNDYKVGRALRNITFAGKGLVDKPANPTSIINPNDVEKSTSSIRENEMPADLATQIEELKKELTAAQATIDSLNTFKSKAETLEVSLSEKDSAIASANEEIKTLKASIADLKSSIETLSKEKEALAGEMDKMNKKAKMEKRKAALVEAGLEDAEADETLASLEALDDAAFDKVVSVMKKGKSKKDMKPKEDEEEVDCGLDGAEEEDASATVTETDADIDADKTSLRTAASQWFSGVLETTKEKTSVKKK